MAVFMAKHPENIPETVTRDVIDFANWSKLARTDLNKKENNMNPKKIDVGFASSIFIEKAISIEEQFESLLGEVKKYHKNDCKNFDPSC